MPSEPDRDDLARIIFLGKPEARWQTWEQTSDGIRAWCRAKADEAMAAGWRKIGADQVVVDWADLDLAAKSLNFREREIYQAMCDLQDRLKAALADPAGANGG